MEQNQSILGHEDIREVESAVTDCRRWGMLPAKPWGRSAGRAAKTALEQHEIPGGRWLTIRASTVQNCDALNCYDEQTRASFSSGYDSLMDDSLRYHG